MRPIAGRRRDPSDADILAAGRTPPRGLACRDAHCRRRCTIAGAGLKGGLPTSRNGQWSAGRRKRSRPRAPRPTRRGATRFRRLPLPATIAAERLCLDIAALIGWRKDIVRHAPQLASFYSAIRLPVNLRGLEFADVKTTTEHHDGVPILVIEGRSSAHAHARRCAAAQIRGSQHDRRGGLFLDRAAVARVAAGETVPFRTRLASPPADGPTYRCDSSPVTTSSQAPARRPCHAF